ncbi:MAG TPA: methionyl-tRNA formyltransferase, partial [Acidimicrobiales bacterium]|nr:methionyl-tRNA formyltransferase [Acidimicrobiales bacterium]
MRLAYLGSPEAAVPPLRALVDAGHDVALVVTQVDKRRGRGGQLVPTPVKAAATELGIPVTHRVADVLDANVELGVVVAFGRIIKPDVLATVPMVNIHFSLLPRWRGAAPVERAILAGDGETAVSIMGVEEGLDTGNIHAEERVAIGDDETADELRDRLVAIGSDLLVRTLAEPLTEGRPQEGEPSYADKIDPAELELDWTRSAADLHRLVRIGRGAWTTFRGKRLRVLAARPTVGRLQPGEIDGPGVQGGGPRGV